MTSDDRGTSGAPAHIEFEDDFELDERDVSSVFFYAKWDGKPVQIRVDADALQEVAPGCEIEDASDQFMDSRARFEELARRLIEQGRVVEGYLDIRARDMRQP